jgi:hypothetical protein
MDTKTYFVEKFDERKLRYIIDNDLYKDDNKDPQWDPNSIIRAYLCKSKKGTIKVSYKYPSYGFGRLNAIDSMSLQNIPRSVRHTIAKDYYYDIDCVNAQPMMLLNYCKLNNIKCSKLEDYVTNRDKYLACMMETKNITRDQAKKYALKAINGSRAPIISDPPSWWVPFCKEIAIIQKQVAELNPDKFEIAEDLQYMKQKKNKNHKYNPHGSCMNLVLCDIENKFLGHMVDYFTKEGFKVGVLVFDGLMIEREDEKKITKKTLKGVEEYIKHKMNYNLQVIIKPMDEGYEIDESALVDDDFLRYSPVSIKYDETININYINQMTNNTNENVIIKSPGGTGKTTYAIDEIKKMKKPKFVSIVSRVSLKEAQKEAFNKADIPFVDYEFMKQQDCNRYNSFIIQVDSLYKLKHIDFSNHIIFCDEINSMLVHLASFENMKERRDNLYTLKEMLNNCKRFIGVDADTSDLVYNTLNAMGVKYKAINNTYDPYSGLVANEKKSQLEMYEAIEKETQALVCFDSAKQARKLYKYLTTQKGLKNVILHIGIKKSSLININTAWKNKIVIYSPTIVYGVDYVPEEKTPVYLFAGISQVTTINPLNMIQQMMRCRNISCIHYYWANNRIKKPFERSLDDVGKFYKQRHFSVFQKLFPLDQGEAFKICFPFFEGEEFYNECIEEAKKLNEIFKILHSHVVYYSIVFNTNPKQHFENLLKGKGINVKPCDEDTKILQDENKELDDQLTEDVKQDEELDYTNWIKGTHECEQWSKVCEIIDVTSADDKEKYKEIIKNPKTHFAMMALKKSIPELEQKQKEKLGRNDFHEMLLKNNYHKCRLLKELEQIIGIEPFTFTCPPPRELENNKQLKSIYAEFKKTFRLTPSTKDGMTTENIFKDIIKIYQQLTDVVDSKRITKGEREDNKKERVYHMNKARMALHEDLFMKKKQEKVVY